LITTLERLLSNETRRNILETTKNPKTFTEIKNSFKITSPSLARHLKSLHHTRLILKNEKDQYQTSQLGCLVVGSLHGLESVSKHSEYLMSHDLSPVPDHLLSSLGDLKDTVQVSPTYRIIELLEEKTMQSIDYYCDLSDDFPGFMVNKVEEKIREGTEFKAVYPENVLREKANAIPNFVLENTELKTLDEVRLTIVVSNQFAFLGLPVGEHVDRNTYLYGEDQQFLDWCMSLFNHYWCRARQYG